MSNEKSIISRVSDFFIFIKSISCGLQDNHLFKIFLGRIFTYNLLNALNTN